jgi:acyl carrier protein
MSELTLEKIMSDILKIPESEITDDLTMDNLDEWDSLRHMDLIVSIEQDFGVELTFDEIIIMRSVVAIKNVLKAKGIPEKWS